MVISRREDSSSILGMMQVIHQSIPIKDGLVKTLLVNNWSAAEDYFCRGVFVALHQKNARKGDYTLIENRPESINRERTSWIVTSKTVLRDAWAEEVFWRENLVPTIPCGD